MKMTVWVGYSDDKPHIYGDERAHMPGVRVLAVYPSRRSAAREYEDIRKATLILAPATKAARRRQA